MRSDASAGLLDASSTPPASGTCAAPWQYTPAVQATNTARFTVRGVDGGLPESLFVNPETGALFWRPTTAQHATFELVATAGTIATAQRVEVEVVCAPLQVGCGCTALDGWPALLVALAALRRRAKA